MKYILLLCIISVSLCSCVPAIFIGGGALGAGVVREKSIGNTIDDGTIWTKIKNNFRKSPEKGLLVNIGVKVNEGRVLLTGEVDKQETRLEALKQVWSVEGVTEVLNELKIKEDERATSDKISSILKDSWITTQIKTRLFMEKHIRSVNFSVETIDQNVYLIGVARSEEELDAATNISGTVKGVNKVISYVRVKTKKIEDKTIYEN